MKSQVDICLRICRALFNDMRLAYPRSASSFERDWKRYSLCVKTRGLGYISLDLPALDDILTDAIRVGRLSTFPLKRKKGTKVPAFLQGLWLRVFDIDGMLLEHADPSAVLFLRQIFKFGKKLENGCSPQRLRKSVEEYINDDSELYPPSLSWDEDELDISDRRHNIHIHDIMASDLPLFPDGENPNGSERLSVVADALTRLQQYADEFCTSFPSYAQWADDDPRSNWGWSGQKHGPGAVADREYSKFKWNSPNYPRKLSLLFPHEMYSTSDEATNHEPPSRLIAVPKTMKSPRLIASEGIWNQNLQQSMMQYLFWLTRQDKTLGIDFRGQELSQDLARRGSLPDDDKSCAHVATVDLSSASDRLSCFVVERLFRKASFLDALHATRTRSTQIQLAGFDLLIRKNKFASQGSATTFPVQTIIFMLIAFAAVGYKNESFSACRERLAGRVRVFGDDIIIPKYGYGKLRLLLSTLQLKVNESKSFAHGLFKESCGGDYFSGYPVSPVQPKSLLPDRAVGVESMLELSNNLHKKGFWQAAAAARIEIAERFKFPVIGRTSSTRGYFSFVGGNPDGLKVRTNTSLQRTEVAVTDIFDKKTQYKHSLGMSFVRHLTHDYREYDNLGFLSEQGTHQPVGSRVRKFRTRWVDVSLLA